MIRLTLFLFLIPCIVFSGEANYPQQFNDQWTRQDFAGMETTLKDWHKSRPNDVEWWVAQGDYLYSLSQKKAPTLLKPSSAVPSVVWCPTPEPFSNPPAKNPSYFDHPLMSQAVTCWQKALFSSPWRLDLYFKLARLYQDLGDFQSQYDTLAHGLQYMDKNRGKLNWVDQKLLPLSTTIPPMLQETIAFYMGQDRPESWEKAHHLIRLAVTFYPDYPYFYNSWAAYYSAQEDWPRTMKYLLIACGKNPQDSLFVFNIGNTLAWMGKTREARIFYRRVVRMNQDPEYVEVAENFLKTSAEPDPK